MDIVLTGVKPTGDAHIGNYLGAIKPALDLAKNPQTQSLLFIADYHSLTSVHKAQELSKATLSVAASWLACGLDPDKTLIYRQSDIPEIFELSWILACFTPKGFMNRAHAYKAKISSNESEGKVDLDAGINMGLFNYPILMSADILIFNASLVPVGEDQIQHVEFARDIAQKFNHNYESTFKLPKAIVKANKLVPGLDGRKMSKSYNNTIPLFIPEKKFRSLIMKIKTDSLPPEAPKDPKTSIIFDLYKEFASPEEINVLIEKYESGIGWGEAKQILFDKMNEHFSPMRERYNALIANPNTITEILIEGAKRARPNAQDFLQEIRTKVGINI